LSSLYAVPVFKNDPQILYLYNKLISAFLSMNWNENEGFRSVFAKTSVLKPKTGTTNRGTVLSHIAPLPVSLACTAISVPTHSAHCTSPLRVKSPPLFNSTSRGRTDLGGFNVSNFIVIKRRMIDIGKKITFYFLQNV
jgi:hypothetical protein